MPVAIDTREHFYKFAQEELEKQGVLTALLPIPFYADYLVTGKTTLAIQRKRVRELMSQYEEVKERMVELKENYPHVALLVEGVYQIRKEMICVTTYGKTQEIGSAIRFKSFLASLVESGFLVIRTCDYNDTLWELIAWNKRLESVTSINRGNLYHPKDRVVSAIACCDGIGWVVAENMLDDLSIVRLCEMSIGELRGISGLGEKKALSLYLFLRTVVRKNTFDVVGDLK